MVDLVKIFWAKSNPYKFLVSHLLEASAVANVLLSDSIFVSGFLVT